METSKKDINTWAVVHRWKAFRERRKHAYRYDLEVGGLSSMQCTILLSAGRVHFVKVLVWAPRFSILDPVIVLLQSCPYM